MALGYIIFLPTKLRGTSIETKHGSHCDGILTQEANEAPCDKLMGFVSKILVFKKTTVKKICLQIFCWFFNLLNFQYHFGSLLCKPKQ